MINNYDLVKRFLPGEELGLDSNGDHFLYTELLDRTKRVGNNGVRIVKTFYHRSLADFDRHMPQMVALCDALKVRAYTRLSTRSFKKVGAEFTRLVVDASLTGNFAGMKSLYTRACGIVTPNKKLWMFDVDRISSESEAFGKWLATPDARSKQPHLVATVPSKKGLHYITYTFSLDKWRDKDPMTGDYLEDRYTFPPDVSLHKDNATNLYIPDEAA